MRTSFRPVCYVHCSPLLHHMKPHQQLSVRYSMRDMLNFMNTRMPWILVYGHLNLLHSLTDGALSIQSYISAAGHVLIVLYWILLILLNISPSPYVQNSETFPYFLHLSVWHLLVIITLHSTTENIHQRIVLLYLRYAVLSICYLLCDRQYIVLNFINRALCCWLSVLSVVLRLP